jgi:hypothetical protein
MDALYVSTIHAACVVLNGRGVLLCGDSGAGKSSLAYACAQEGWDYMCDDACSLLRDRKDRTVIGNPYSLRLRPDAGRLFPEFKQRLASSRPNGKVSFEIATSNELPIKLVTECQAHFIVFLEREDNAIPAIYPLPKEHALEVFARTISFGSAEYRRNRMAHYRNLLDVPVFGLRYSNLESAVDRLSRMVRSVR